MRLSDRSRLGIFLNREVKHFKQLLKFGVVGGISTLINSVVFLLLVDFFKVPPLLGNFLAFLCAFSISYLGHAKWTFDRDHNTKRLTKFLVVALLGLGMNSSFVWLLSYVLHQPPIIVLIPMIFITPMILFFINKLWVFSNSR